tara:strand:+ start:37 stop:567 length:531 start_codon:yes stop_codon:yes gene_type:complete
LRKSVSYKKQISTSAENLWKLISSPGHLNLVHPFCKKNEILVWNKDEHKDILVYLNGLRYEREFILWNENKGYSLLIGEAFEKTSKVDWKIESKNRFTYLRIRVSPYLFEKLPKFLYLPLFYLVISPMLKNYLKSVLNGIEWYTVKNTPVTKNMFGKHLWFSNFWINKFLFKSPKS